jgi:Ala-tRNA(Pro) deacylase
MDHPIAERILAVLAENGAWHEHFAHAPVRTSEEAAQLRPGYRLRQGTKALIVRVRYRGGARGFVMLVVPGDAKFDSAKVKEALNAKDIRFATPEEVRELTDGVEPGGVPPFGNLFGLPVVTDPGIYDNDVIIFNASRTHSIAMRSADYRRLVRPVVARIV